MNMQKSLNNRILARNKRAFFNFDISKTFDAGIALKGHEVKSIRTGLASLREGFVRIEKGEVWLVNVHIPLWKYANISNYDSKAKRKLLLTKQEIKELGILIEAKKMSIVPLEFYSYKNKIKLKIGSGKPRKKYDKRKSIKEKEMKRQVREELSGKERF
jgi:SsrA-binding protein